MFCCVMACLFRCFALCRGMMFFVILRRVQLGAVMLCFVALCYLVLRYVVLRYAA